MKFITPIQLTDAMLISSNVPETDYAAWNAATSYTVGTYVIRTTTHRIYKNLIAGVDATLPENATAGASPRWLDVGPVNRWAMFDQSVGTVTSQATSIVTTIAPGQVVDSLALLDLYAASVQVQVKDGPSGSVVYDKTFDVSNGQYITNWADYFLLPVAVNPMLLVFDLPLFANPYITITISGATAKCGTLAFGRVTEIGGTAYGAKIGITDYSKKSTDAFGVTTVVKRSYAKRNECMVLMENVLLDQMVSRLSEVRATPCIWIASDGYSSLVIYGFYKDWYVTISYPTHSECAITIEGLV